MITAAALVAVAFGVLAFRHLRSAAYSRAVSAICALLTVGQVVASVTTAFVPALLLALVIYFIVVQATYFVQVQNVRNVMLLAGSLALVQVVNPLGTVIAAALVPVLIGLQDTAIFRSRGRALFVLLLFIPVSAAVFLAYLEHATSLSFSALLAQGVARHAVGVQPESLGDFRMEGMIHAAELIAIGFPMWVTAAVVRSRASFVIATVCLAVIMAVAIATFLGRMRPIALIAPSLALPCVLVLCEWPQARRDVRLVAAAPAFSALLTWFCVEFAA